MERLFLSMPSEDLAKFENAREQLHLNRSQFVRYLIGGQKDIRPPSLKYNDVIKKINNIELNIKNISMKENVTDDEILLLVTKLEEVKEQLALLLINSKGEI